MELQQVCLTPMNNMSQQVVTEKQNEMLGRGVVQLPMLLYYAETRISLLQRKYLNYLLSHEIKKLKQTGKTVVIQSRQGQQLL